MKLLIVVLLVVSTLAMKKRVLVLSDNPSIAVSHSMLFNELKNIGLVLTFKSFQSTQVNLLSYGETNYDHIIVFASSEESVQLKTNEIHEFFDLGNNVMILGNIDQSKYFRYLLNGFGLDSQPQTQVFDHFSNIHPSDPNTIITSNYIKNTPFTANVTKPLVYRGVGLYLTPYETHQVYGVVMGSETAYSVDLEADVVQAPLVLVGAVQGRNNARIVASGSIDLLSDEFLSRSEYGNLELARALLRWNFGLSGVLKAGDITHRSMESNQVKPNAYKVSEEIYFSCEIWEWCSESNQWVGFKTPEEGDILMEFVMLDPYYRIPLVPNKQNTQKYEVQYRLPDKYGVFQFKINYQRPGYSFLQIAEKITIRPYRHDEYERYLQQAYPYYFSTFGTIIGFLVFVLFFLTNKEEIKDKQD